MTCQWILQTPFKMGTRTPPIVNGLYKFLLISRHTTVEIRQLVDY